MYLSMFFRSLLVIHAVFGYACSGSRGENLSETFLSTRTSSLMRVRRSELVGDVTEDIAEKNLTKEPRILFGSASCLLDALPVSEMLPYQIRQSAETKITRRVLYACDEGKYADQSHSARLDAWTKQVEQLQANGIVDEVIRVDTLDTNEIANGILLANTALWYPQLTSPEYTKVMIAFLKRCVQEQYDHCAWLDGDVFVHRGSDAWIDAAVRTSNSDPHIAISEPYVGTAFGAGDQCTKDCGFSSRHFIYHRAAMERHLPLGFAIDRNGGTLEELMTRPDFGSFEDLVNDNAIAVSQEEKSISWAIHPPDDQAALRKILKACGTDENHGLRELLSSIEHGMTQDWRDTTNYQNMNEDKWYAELHQECVAHPLVAALLEFSQFGSQRAETIENLSSTRRTSPAASG